MLGISGETLTALVEAAARAPSGDNCQPWRFLWDGERLRVVFLPDRAESLYDVRNAASWISLGAVLTNLRVAAGHLGLEVAADVFPGDDAPGVVARARLTPARPTDETLWPALDARCVNRRPYRRDPLPTAIRDELQALGASTAGVHLSWIEDPPTKARLAALAACNERILFENRPLHDGLYRWLRWSPAEIQRTGDGMPVESLELWRPERAALRLMGSWPRARLFTALGASRTLPLRSRQVYARSAAIALLTVEGADRTDFVRGGEVLERIWLTATLRNVAFQPITGIIFLLLRLALEQGRGLSVRHQSLVDRVARDLWELFPEVLGQTPVMLFRLGLAPPPTARAPRLPSRRILSIE